jgi:predicted dienelactone hydrolase
MPARSGTYAVGHDTISIPDPSTGKTITADLWYPAADGATGTFARYSLLPTAYFDSTVAIEDAPINSAGAFPFVVYSHGSGARALLHRSSLKTLQATAMSCCPQITMATPLLINLSGTQFLRM